MCELFRWLRKLFDRGDDSDEPGEDRLIYIKVIIFVQSIPERIHSLIVHVKGLSLSDLLSSADENVVGRSSPMETV